MTNVTTMHDIRLRAEARAQAAAAIKLLSGPELDHDTLETALEELQAAAHTVNCLITARIRGGDAGAQPRKVEP